MIKIKKNKASRSFKSTSNELLQDLKYAAMYLEECLVDGDIELFKLALKNVADARLGGMTVLAKKTKLGRESLYKALSRKGNPRLDTLKKVIDATGLRISITVQK